MARSRIRPADSGADRAAATGSASAAAAATTVAATGARARAPRKPRLSRQEKSERTRAAICQAAAEVIGEYGYANASISRIMERAGLGHGTFYAYFDSRQDLFDALLPMKGEEVLGFVQERVRGAPDFIDMEYRGFLGFFEYVQKHPWFFRLLHEAQVAAPDGHHRHINNILTRYRKALRRAHDAGEMPGYDASELDTLAFLLMSARDYVYSQQVARSDDAAETIQQAVRTYAKFVAHGLRGAEPQPETTAGDKTGVAPREARGRKKPEDHQP